MENCLSQHIEVPTHVGGNILDLIITKEEELVHSVDVGGRLGKSDHEMVTAVLNIDLIVDDRIEYARDFNRANYIEMRGSIEATDWRHEFDNRNIEESWSYFKNMLDELVEASVPLRRKRRATAPKWVDKEVKKAVREKRRAWDQWKRTRGESDKRMYKACEAKVKKLVKNKKNAIEREIARDCRSNLKRNLILPH